MQTQTFVKPTRAGGKLRLALTGRSFTGKSMTAFEIAGHLVPGGEFAVIDTEDKARLYEGRYNFAVMVLADFTPQAYINAIHAAEQAGYDVLVIDGLSDAWTEVKRIVSRESNTQRGWGKATPLQEDLQQAIRTSPLHIIATMRALEDEKKRLQVIQRDTMLYEFADLGELDEQHTLRFRKTYTPALRGKAIQQPGAQVAAIYRDWLQLDTDRKRVFADRIIQAYGHLGFADMTGVKELLDLAGETYSPDREAEITQHIAQAVADWQEQQRRQTASSSPARSDAATVPAVAR